MALIFCTLLVGCSAARLKERAKVATITLQVDISDGKILGRWNDQWFRIYTLWTLLNNSQPWAKRSRESNERWKVVEQVLDKDVTEEENALDEETGAAAAEDNDEEEENVCAGLLNILLHCKLLQITSYFNRGSSFQKSSSRAATAAFISVTSGARRGSYNNVDASYASAGISLAVTNPQTWPPNKIC